MLWIQLNLPNPQIPMWLSAFRLLGLSPFKPFRVQNFQQEQVPFPLKSQGKTRTTGTLVFRGKKKTGDRLCHQTVSVGTHLVKQS